MNLMLWYIMWKKIKNRKKHETFNKKQIESILVLFKMFTETEFCYWFTKLEMTALIWTMRRISHMIKASKYSTVIYIDHEINLAIAAKTKLNITNIDKLNIKLIKTSIYLFQFWLNVSHWSDKFNIIPDVLSRLSIIKNRQKFFFWNRRREFKIRSDLCLRGLFDENVLRISADVEKWIRQRFSMKKNQIYAEKIEKEKTKKTELIREKRDWFCT